jgi:hypothetical protein
MRNDESSSAALAVQTAAVAGNYAEARRLRLEALVDALGDLRFFHCKDRECQCECPKRIHEAIDTALAVMLVTIPDEA